MPPTRYPQPKSPHILANELDAFNKQFPIGTPVNVRLDDGTLKETNIRSEAWTMGGHSNVVKVDGIAGGYMIERITKR